ncbi:MAG: 23S rRNA (guanosine(2251)-2'-O)-methyltransferase RlmB [Firmicutes bacterium]|nr:23S rRNA (guanosine(2251)-2'-O)-methyltransferase RlmB [Bacillota bacterium]
MIYVESKNAVIEALNSDGGTLSKILLAKEDSAITQLAKAKGVKVEVATKEKLDRLVLHKRHGGVIGLMESGFRYSSVQDIIKRARERARIGESVGTIEKSSAKVGVAQEAQGAELAKKGGAKKGIFLLLLTNIEDPHNLGAIIRTAECAGVDGIIIPKDRASEVNATVIRVSSGAAFHIPIAQANINSAVDIIKKENIFVFGLEAAEAGGASKKVGCLYKTNLKGDICLVVGGEDKGISHLTKKLCDGLVSIRMEGKVTSLNASVSAGVAIYEVVRQNLL